jgi:hypothetical protein
MYSLGQTVAFITTGKHPVSGERPQVPRIWESLVAKMTVVAVSERFQTMDELGEALLGVQRQLKEQRKAEWSAGQTAVGGLSQAELMVMKMVIEETNTVFREHEILNGRSKRERATFNIGIIALKQRNFVEDNLDDEGRLWGYRLTDAAHKWLVANPDFLNAFPSSEPESPQDSTQDDDGIPF